MAETVTQLHPADPTDLPSHYSAEDRRAVARLRTWLDQPGRSISALAKLTGAVRATLSMCLNGTYTSSPSEHLSAALAAIEGAAEREAEVLTIPYVEGSVHRMLALAVRRARQYRSVVVFAGDVGTGKTRSARELAAATPHLSLIEAYGEMSTAALLDEICHQLDLQVPTWSPGSQKMGAIVRRLKGTVHVLMVDEAETLAAPHRRAQGARSLEALRRIRDLAEVGLVLIGTPAIDDVIGRGQFDQLRSRTNLRPETLRGVPREDIESVTRAALDDQGEIPDAVLDALWRSAGGRTDKAGRETHGASMRVLVEGLLPGLRDFGLNRGKPLSASLVRAVARQALGLREDLA